MGKIDIRDREIVHPMEEIHRIIKEIFTQQELFSLQQERIDLLFVVSNTGSVLEVDFFMNPTERLLAVPLEKFARMETEFKKLQLAVGPVTRSLQYNYTGFVILFSDISVDLPPLKPDPGIIRKN